MAIRYKVTNMEDKSIVMDFPEFILTYKDGEIVEAKKDTLGILCFHIIDQCKKFCKESIHYKYKIKKVETLGKGKKIEYVGPARHLPSLRDFYTTLKKNNKSDYDNYFLKMYTPPAGTIAYKKIKVLETIETIETHE